VNWEDNIENAYLHCLIDVTEIQNIEA